MTDEIYREYLISPVWVYTDGKADFQIYPERGNEEGTIHHRDTMKGAKEFVDFLIDD